MTVREALAPVTHGTDCKVCHGPVYTPTQQARRARVLRQMVRLA